MQWSSSLLTPIPSIGIHNISSPWPYLLSYEHISPLRQSEIGSKVGYVFIYKQKQIIHFFKIRYQRSKSCIKMSSDCTLISDKNKMDCHYLHAPSCVQWRKREKMGVHPPIPPNCELLWCSICLAVPGSEFCSLRGRISSCVFPTKLQQTTTVFFSPGSF
jgi:hypothetical protein